MRATMTGHIQPPFCSIRGAASKCTGRFVNPPERLSNHPSLPFLQPRYRSTVLPRVKIRALFPRRALDSIFYTILFTSFPLPFFLDFYFSRVFILSKRYPVSFFFFFSIFSLVTLKEEMDLGSILFINFDKYHVASRERLLSSLLCLWDYIFCRKVAEGFERIKENRH